MPPRSRNRAIDSRKVILRTLLGSLAVAAVAGVLAVLTAARWVTLRVTWTGLLTAAAAGMILLFTLMLDRRRTRPAGLLGITVVIAEYVLALLLIWISTLPNRVVEEIGLTMGFTAVTGAAAVGYLVLARVERTRLAGVLGVGGAALTFVLLEVAVWLPGALWSDEEWLLTGWLAGGLGIVITACAIPTGPRDAWRWLGAAAAVIAYVLIAADLWDRPIAPEEWSLPPLSLAMLLAFANLHMIPRAGTAHRWIRAASIASAAVMFVALNAIAFDAVDAAGEELLGRLAGAGGIVAGCGSLAAIVLTALHRRRGADDDREIVATMSATCPRCRGALDLPAGTSTCPHCRLRFKLWFESPRCAECGYLLTSATMNRCPECGAAIAAASAT